MSSRSLSSAIQRRTGNTNNVTNTENTNTRLISIKEIVVSHEKRLQYIEKDKDKEISSKIKSMEDEIEKLKKLISNLNTNET
tara:strand:- start:363 stop:608 length:246 start_codon:yes stop_codon:yes gene_type:complete